MRETDLYLPVKRHLEAQGYAVKAEVKSCDVVAVRGDEAPVIVELKTSFTLQLLFQATDRLAMTENVYVAIPRPKRGITSSAVKLCRRIGLGLIIVAASGSLEVMTDPLPSPARKDTKRRGLLLKEFARREGDPNTGGSNRTPLMTAYRQDALRMARHLETAGPSRVRDIRAITGVDRSANILRDNVYGWFAKTERGVYGLTPKGVSAVTEQRLAVQPAPAQVLP